MTASGFVLLILSSVCLLLLLVLFGRLSNVARQLAEMRNLWNDDRRVELLREDLNLRAHEASSDLQIEAAEIRELIRGLANQATPEIRRIIEATQGLTEILERIRAIHTEAPQLVSAITQVASQSSFVGESLNHQADKIREHLLSVDTMKATAERAADDLAKISYQVSENGRLFAGMNESLDRIFGSTNALRFQVGSIDSKTTNFVGALALLLPRLAHDFPIDQENLAKKTEPELVVLAESLAILRPLIPYPRWRFDADWSNPDLTFQVRQWLWQQFHDRRYLTPIHVPWHGGARLRLFLGTDLSRQIYIAGCIDPNEFAFLDRLLEPGMTFFDVGANDGIYAIFAATRVTAKGMVWAFEPSHRELDRLRCNLDLNHLDVQVFPIALADICGQGELTVAGYEHEGQNTLGAFAYDGVAVAGKETVELTRLDDVVARHPPDRIDVIKADVEGAEVRLFRGAQATLKRYRPVLLFEVSDAALRNQGSNAAELLEFIQQQGYGLFNFDERTGLPTPAGEQPCGDNLIAVPSERSLPRTVYSSWPEAKTEFLAQ